MMSDSRRALADSFKAAGASLAADLKALDAEMRSRVPAAERTLYYADWLLANRTA